VRAMKIGYQGEGHSYSHRATTELFPDAEREGFPSFASAFHALRDGEVDRLVLPIENSTTGSVLPVLNRLARNGNIHIVGEHLVEVRHALVAPGGATLETIKTVHSHPEALAQADDAIEQRGWRPVPTHDTAGAIRQVAERADPTEAALGSADAALGHGLHTLQSDFMDQDHNTTRFVVLGIGDLEVAGDATKTSVMFFTGHTPGALALSLTELGLRGANLTRIESRPSDEAWRYRFFVDFLHPPGPAGLATILDPKPNNIADLRILGTYHPAG
jgi:prephenate dehydratase